MFLFILHETEIYIPIPWGLKQNRVIILLVLFSKLFRLRQRDMENFEIYCDNLNLHIRNIGYLSLFTFLSLNHGDIERNPGTRKAKIENCSCCHWMLVICWDLCQSLFIKKEKLVFIGSRCFYKLKKIFNCKISIHIIFNQMHTF